MNLTKRQLLQLKRGREMKDNPPTMFSYLKTGKWKYLYMFLLFGCISIYAWFQKEYIVLAFVIGYSLGVFYRDFQWAVVFRRFWPISLEITNWDRVDELISENENQTT